MALPAHSGPWLLIQFRNHFSQTAGLLRRVISPSQGRYLNTGQHKQNKRIHTKHPCLEWDSNPRSQRQRERRQLMPQTARLLWPAQTTTIASNYADTNCLKMVSMAETCSSNKYHYVRVLQLCRSKFHNFHAEKSVWNTSRSCFSKTLSLSNIYNHFPISFSCVADTAWMSEVAIKR
jgi:hypothetical protein